MFIYFWFIRLAALLGHSKAKKMVAGQRVVKARMAAKDLPQDAVWFHAASVGEFEQARPIIEWLRANRPEQKIIVTFFSPSGYEMRKNYNQADAVCYLPFATRRKARRWIEATHPKMAIFVKYEFWPAYIKALHTHSVPMYSISAIFRPNQLFFKPWGKWYLKLLSYFTRLFVQNEESASLLRAHGIEQVQIAGDTRFDRVYAIAKADTSNDERLRPLEQFIGSSQKVIVAGSTWPPDERLLARYVAEHEDVRLVLVPHEIDAKHLHFIFNEWEGRRCLYSEWKKDSSEYLGPRTLVVDTMGILSKSYRLGQVAYIGGGFGVGIHNTLEAAVYGMPVLFGPNCSHFREALGLIAAGGAVSVTDYASFEAAMDHALANHEQMGKCAIDYIESELGATQTIVNEIFK